MTSADPSDGGREEEAEADVEEAGARPPGRRAVTLILSRAALVQVELLLELKPSSDVSSMAEEREPHLQTLEEGGPTGPTGPHPPGDSGPSGTGRWEDLSSIKTLVLSKPTPSLEKGGWVQRGRWRSGQNEEKVKAEERRAQLELKASAAPDGGGVWACLLR